MDGIRLYSNVSGQEINMNINPVVNLPDTCSINIEIENTGLYFGEHSPIVFDNLLIARPSVQDGGGRGFVVAYDVNTQKEVWR